jgi:alpha/beta superfamily hydrolase
MQISRDAKPLLWGAFGGAALCALVGFTWGGWVTEGGARAQAAIYAHDAVVTALAPVCADRFRAQADAPTQIAVLGKSSTWERGGIVEKSGFASMSGSKGTDSDVARACAEMLMAPTQPKT